MHQMKFEDKRKALEELGVSFAKPKHPEFSLVAKRYGSFSEWRYHQSPDSLARAGFYYTGKQIKKELIHIRLKEHLASWKNLRKSMSKKWLLYSIWKARHIKKCFIWNYGDANDLLKYMYI